MILPLQEFINKKYMNGYTKNTLSGFYGVLSGALKAAVNPYQFIKENPMQYVSMPKYDNSKKDKGDLKIITLDTFNRIIERFPVSSNFHIPLQVGFHTGARASEVCGLTWGCVNLKERSISIEKILKRNVMGTENVTTK